MWLAINWQLALINSQIETNIVEIAGSNVETIQTFSAINVHFSSSQDAILTLKEESSIGNITTTSNNLHSLALNTNLVIVGDVGSDSNRLKEIKLLANNTVSITNSNFYAAVSTITADSGKILFDSGNSVAYGNLGTDEFRLSDVTFDSNSTVKADIYSKKITINADKTASFAGTNARTMVVPGANVGGSELPRLLKKFTYHTRIDSENIDTNPSSKIKFDNAALVNVPINGGQVILVDNVWFKENIVSSAPVSFTAAKYVILEKDIKCASIEANQSKIIILAEKQAIAGDLTAKNLTMDIGTGQLKYTGNAKLTGTLQLDTFYDTSKMAGGNIEIQSNSKLDISQLDKLNVKVIARSDINKISEDTKHTLISSVDGNGGIVALDISKISFDPTSEQNRFVSWTIDPSTLTLHAKDISKEVLEKEFASSSIQDQTFIEQSYKAMKVYPNSDIAKFINGFGLMDKDAKLVFERLLPDKENLIVTSLINPHQIIRTLVITVANQITGRIAPIGTGDDDKIMYGVWGSSFYSTADKKMQQGVSGYNMKSTGLIMGFDGLVNDDLLLGTAYSLIDTRMSHKNQKNGDKTNGKTNIFSLYGLYKFAANWFTESIASYGITKVKNLEERLVPTNLRSVTTLDTAVAKYQSISYGGQLFAGYNYQPSEKLMITPTIGFRYSQFMYAGYTETGTAYQNLVVKKRSYNKFEGILGLRTATNIKLDQVLLVPELHGYVNYDFRGKAPIIDARLGGIDEPLPAKLAKPAKVFFTVGTSLTAKHNMVEYGVAYNANIANKYIGHQGSLKVKVNF